MWCTCPGSADLWWPWSLAHPGVPGAPGGRSSESSASVTVSVPPPPPQHWKLVLASIARSDQRSLVIISLGAGNHFALFLIRMKRFIFIIITEETVSHCDIVWRILFNAMRNKIWHQGTHSNNSGVKSATFEKTRQQRILRIILHPLW